MVGKREIYITWDEYCRLRKEVKEAVTEKNRSIWNEMVEKANVDFKEKAFWAFVGRCLKGKKHV